MEKEKEVSSNPYLVKAHVQRTNTFSVRATVEKKMEVSYLIKVVQLHWRTDVERHERGVL